MTHNSIQYMANLEDARHNAAQEAENLRHNKAMEVETARSNLANEAIGRKNAKSNAKNAKSNVKNATTNRLQYKRQAKDSRVERRNTKARTENTKRATQHYNVEEAQGWTSLEIDKMKAITDARYKDRMAKISADKNSIQKERNYNDLLVSAAKDPKFWAYLMATGKIPPAEIKKAKDTVEKTVKDAVDKGVSGMNAIWYSYVRPYVSEVNPNIASAFDAVVETLTGSKHKIKKSKIGGSKTHKTSSGNKAGGKGGKF